jgi:Fe-S-cluster containining protein
MTAVPCNGCTACCQRDLIFLKPELGDVVETYETFAATNPLTGEQGIALKHKPGGGCIYVDEHGCTIHDRAPVVCREFDCRALYLKLFSIPRPERRRLQAKFRKRNLMSKEVMDAARARLHTLKEKAA